jgi:uncharacterized protein
MDDFPAVKAGDTPLLFRNIQPPNEGQFGYDGSETSTVVLPAGYRKSETTRPFTVNTIFEKNVNIPLRDGTILKADIFRPETSDKVPVLLPWSPYGKSGRGTGTRALRVEVFDP